MIEQFARLLQLSDLSGNTITSYCKAVENFYHQYGELNKKNLLSYKGWLIENYKAKTVKIVDFSIEHKEKSMATDAVNLIEHINNIENFVKANRKINKNQIEFCAFELNKLTQRLYVFYQIHSKSAIAEKNMGDNNKESN